MKGKKFLSIVACGLGFVMLSGATNAEAISITDAKAKYKTEVSAEKTKAEKTKVEKKGVKKNKENKNTKKDSKKESKTEVKEAANTNIAAGSFQERIDRILHPEKYQDSSSKTKVIIDMNADDNLIMGGAKATQEQCVRFLLSHNPYPKLNVSPEELVAYYYEEGSRVGVRPDIAFAQALKETGYFRYGGTVVPAQNNYCGLGTTSATVRGAYFSTPRLGVKAHIQHLLAYASTEKPDDNIVDPRYDLVRDSYGERTLTQWKDLNGRWAVPGVGYGQSILEDYYKGILDS